jgi:hypothetical protein
VRERGSGRCQRTVARGSAARAEPASASPSRTAAQRPGGDRAVVEVLELLVAAVREVDLHVPVPAAHRGSPTRAAARPARGTGARSPAAAAAGNAEGRDDRARVGDRGEEARGRLGQGADQRGGLGRGLGRAIGAGEQKSAREQRQGRERHTRRDPPSPRIGAGRQIAPPGARCLPSVDTAVEGVSSRRSPVCGAGSAGLACVAACAGRRVASPSDPAGCGHG